MGPKQFAFPAIFYKIGKIMKIPQILSQNRSYWIRIQHETVFMFKLLAAIPAADVMATVNLAILFMNFTPLNLDQISKKFQILKSENDLQLS